MKRPRSSAGCALAITLSACATAPEGSSVFPFDDAAPGAVPATWQAAETNGRGTPGSWRVADSDGDRYVRLAETTNRGQTFNLLFAPGRFPADVEIAVRLRADTGSEDQGGGVVWRAEDADNYYIARWNPLEDNLRAYKVVDGKRRQLASADIHVEPGWHDLGIVMTGSQIEVTFDGAAVLQLDDATFSNGGMVGLWTKADAATSFDDFRVTPL